MDAVAPKPGRVVKEKPVRAVERPRDSVPKEKPARPIEPPRASVPKEKPAPAVKPPRERAPKVKPVRAVKPREPLFKRLPARADDHGPRAYRPTFDISEGNWATAATIRSLENKWQAAIKDHDLKALDQLLAENLTATSSTGKEGSKATLLREVRRDKNVYKSAHARGMSVRNDGPGKAIVTGIATESGITKDGKTFKTKRRFTDTWKLHKGVWRCVESKVTDLTGTQREDQRPKQP